MEEWLPGDKKACTRELKKILDFLKKGRIFWSNLAHIYQVPQNQVEEVKENCIREMKYGGSNIKQMSIYKTYISICS